MHEEMSGTSASFTHVSGGSIGRNKVYRVQNFELQERKINSRGNKGLKGQCSDRRQLDPSPLGLQPYEAPGLTRYGLRLRQRLPWVARDARPTMLIKGEDKLQTHKATQSLKNIFEEVEAEVAVEQDEWAKELRTRLID